MNSTQQEVIYILSGIALIAGGLIGYFIYTMVRQVAEYHRLQDGYNKIKLEALEHERQMIAADLHDDIGPILSSTLFRLGEIEPVTEREKEQLRQSYKQIDGLFVRIRRLSSMMVPQDIERRGPLYALREFADKYLAGQQLKLEFTPHICPGLNAYGSLHLFRMLQEILHNTLKHAKASELSVHSSISNNELFIETSDNGIGFDPATVQQGQGLGLQNLAIRARMIGASIETRSWPGRGTRYNIRVGLKG